MAFFVSVSLNIYCLVCICSILSEKSLRIFSLEFSGLHYCLFVKVLCLVLCVVEHATLIYYHISRRPSIPFFEIFYNFFNRLFCPDLCTVWRRSFFAVGLYDSTDFRRLSTCFFKIFTNLPTGNDAYRISTPYSTPARYLQRQTDTTHNTICPCALTDIAAGNTVSAYKE